MSIGDGLDAKFLHVIQNGGQCGVLLSQSQGARAAESRSLASRFPTLGLTRSGSKSWWS
jgi:hypothetical protein